MVAKRHDLDIRETPQTLQLAPCYIHLVLEAGFPCWRFDVAADCIAIDRVT
jgi:hypothetical protein